MENTDVLFRLSNKEEKGGFPDIGSADKYFKEQIHSKDEGYFYTKRQIIKFKEVDKIYFSLDSYLIYIAKFTGEYKENKEDEYSHGYKLNEIQRIDNTNEEIDNKIFGGGQSQLFYINTEKKKKEIESLLNANTSIYPDEIPAPNLLIEGAKKSVTVNAFERNPKAREECIDEHGYFCSVCSFNFEKKYGDIGKNFIHVHHLKQISNIGKEYVVDPIKDLIPVCPNCHAMLHKENPPYDIEKIKSMIAEQTKKPGGKSKKKE